MLGQSFLPFSAGYFLRRAHSYVRHAVDRYRATESSGFYVNMNAGGYSPNAHVDVVPEHKLIYVSVPKCASTSIKLTLSHLRGGKPTSLENVHRRRVSRLQSPFDIGADAFHRLATDPSALCFTFVRNPYDRLVSAWADKFQGVSLASDDPFIAQYLSLRAAIDPALPDEDGGELGFSDFVTYATATADQRINAHWQIQDDIVTMPGLDYGMIGRVEHFNRDFARVLDHVGADARLRSEASIPLRASPRQTWSSYYDEERAARVYRAYQRDFDRFGYVRALPADAAA